MKTEQMMADFEIMRHKPFGVELALRLTVNPDAATASLLRKLLYEHQLLVFRNQSLSLDDQQRAMTVFGPVVPAPEGVGFVSNERADGILGKLELAFHSDASFAPLPYRALSLLAVDVVGGATSTRFASGRRAYDRLPGALRDRIAGLNSFHMYRKPDDYKPRPKPNANGTRTRHPVVLPHPDTSVPVLFVTELATSHIVGLSAGDSDALLDELFSHLYDAENIVEHHWHRGDLVVWDNVAVQHSRNRVDTSVRTLQRVVVAERSLMDMYPSWVVAPPNGAAS